ncbi:MAG: hypothetical protein ABL958_02860 [Bdellovibrionia bacterium]
MPPTKIIEMSKQLTAYFGQTDQAPSLILDSTGPGLTMHLPVLEALSKMGMGSFQEIHAFSGGAMAYVCQWAKDEGFLKHSVEYYAENYDKIFRQNHHRGFWSPLKALFLMLLGKSAWSYSTMATHLHQMFKPEFMAAPVSILPENFTFYLGRKDSGEVVTMDAKARRESNLTMEEALTAIVGMPGIYGYTPNSFYDSVYSPGYKAFYRNLLRVKRPKVIVAAIAKQGSVRGNFYVNPLGNGLLKSRMMGDIFRLLFNMPNPQYRRDISAAWAR